MRCRAWSRVGIAAASTLPWRLLHYGHWRLTSIHLPAIELGATRLSSLAAATADVEWHLMTAEPQCHGLPVPVPASVLPAALVSFAPAKGSAAKCAGGAPVVQLRTLNPAADAAAAAVADLCLEHAAGSGESWVTVSAVVASGARCRRGLGRPALLGPDLRHEGLHHRFAHPCQSLVQPPTETGRRFCSYNYL